jgi:hypothetical protein
VINRKSRLHIGCYIVSSVGKVLIKQKYNIFKFNLYSQQNGRKSATQSQGPVKWQPVALLKLPLPAAFFSVSVCSAAKEDHFYEEHNIYNRGKHRKTITDGSAGGTSGFAGTHVGQCCGKENPESGKHSNRDVCWKQKFKKISLSELLQCFGYERFEQSIFLRHPGRTCYGWIYTLQTVQTVNSIHYFR